MLPIVAKVLDVSAGFSSDAQFNLLYPASIQQLADRHWTPLSVAEIAADFLATGEGARILDIGSGVGTGRSMEASCSVL